MVAKMSVFNSWLVLCKDWTTVIQVFNVAVQYI